MVPYISNLQLCVLLSQLRPLPVDRMSAWLRRPYKIYFLLDFDCVARESLFCEALRSDCQEHLANNSLLDPDMCRPQYLRHILPFACLRADGFHPTSLSSALTELECATKGAVPNRAAHIDLAY